MAVAGESELSLRKEQERKRENEKKRKSVLIPHFFSFSLFLFFSFVSPASAQGHPADSLPRITSIALDNRPVFDTTEHGLIARAQNFFHRTTGAQFISQEFLFRVGDRYDSARVAETERNLRALHVFKSVAIDTVPSDSGIIVRVTTRDNLTFSPQFSFRNSGGSAAYGVTGVETNFLGTLTSAQIGFRHDPDRNTYLFGLARRRLINDKIGGTIQLFQRTDGSLLFAQLAQPYFEAASHTSVVLTLDDRRTRILQFLGGNDSIPSAKLQNRYIRGRVDFGRALYATPLGYVRIGVAAQIRRDDYTTDSLWQANGFATNSTTGAFGVYAEASRVRKPKVFAFQSLSQDEDIDLSPTITASLFVAPTALGYTADHAGLAPGIGLHSGMLIPGGFAYADVAASGLFNHNGLDSGQVYAGVTAVVAPGRRHQLIVHAETSALKNPLPGTEFDLGLGAGPRAFGYHSFTGDREYFVTAEYRFTLGLDVLKAADIGLAAFIDRGGAWWSGDPHRAGWDVGIGLRHAPAHGVTGMNRVDLAWRGTEPGRPGGWVLAVGTGLLFANGLRGGSR